MIVCLVNGVFPPDQYGGAENYVSRVAEALADRGHEVHVLTTTSERSLRTLRIETEEMNGFSVHRFYPLNLSHRSEGTGDNPVTKALWHQLDTVNPHAKRIVSGFLNKYDPDVVHTNNFMGITASVGKAVEQSDARYIHTLHDYSLICPKSNLLRDMTLPDDELAVCENPPAPCRAYAGAKRHSIGCPDLILGPSQHVIDVHRQHGFFEEIESKCIQHGIEECADSVPERESDAVLYVGKHLRAKGIETLFKAAQELPEITIHFCGTGPYDDQTEKIATRLDNVEYHGYVSEQRLRELRHEVAAAVVPSIWMENSPLTIYESFAEGLPVIGANIGGIPELVDDGRGWLFPPQDFEELAAVIQSAVSADCNRGERALSWAKEHSIERHLDRLVATYMET